MTGNIADFYQAILEAFESAILVEDSDRTCLHMNGAFARMFGIARDKDSCRAMADEAKGQFRDPIYFLDRIERLMAAREKVVEELVFMADGRCLQRDYIPVEKKNTYIGHLWVYRDVTRAHAAAVRDSLTGLYNRRGLDMFAGHAMARARRDQDGLCAVVCDLDGLKSVNDSQGHGAGDRVISKSASVILRTFRSSDICVRMGGDEFLVLATGFDADAMTRRLTEQLQSHGISASVGSALWDGESLEELVARADASMYARKGSIKRS